MEEIKHRRQYDKEFKREAVRLVMEGNRRASEVARDLGIEENMLHRWKREYEEGIEGAFTGKGKLRPEKAELRQLQKELEDVREKRDI